MQLLEGRFVYSAGDLNEYLECKRLTELSGLVALGKLQLPQTEDEQLELIRRKGEQHEESFLKKLRESHGEGLVSIARSERRLDAFVAAEQQTLAAMAAGARIVYQATFFDGEFLGHADFLRRVEKPCALWPWSYEVVDTKLALSPKPYFLIQLCNYSEHLLRLQGTLPEHGYIVLGNGAEERFRLHDYMAYYRHLKQSFLHFTAQSVSQDEPNEYPFQRAHCSICPWDAACTQKRRADDHLSLVAWMRRDQIAKLEDAGITTVARLAEAPSAPFGMNPDSFAKLRRQAAMQMRGRTSAKPLYDFIDAEPAAGFALLPEPATGDLFFDIEGDPLYEPGRGLEYLFGFWTPGEKEPYRAFWALNRAQEKETFEEVVDFLVERRKRFPAMHVYHYAEYEKSALRRLAQAHCTREEEVDQLLRAEAFVDLYAVVRQAFVLSEESYGLKSVERFYNFRRATDVKHGDESIVMFERWLTGQDQKILDDIANYNRDDCRSTQLLHAWILERRTEAIETRGYDVSYRPVKKPEEPCHAEFVMSCNKCKKRQADEREENRRTRLERELMAGVLMPQSDEEYRLMHETPRMRFLLANLLAYHRREDKPVWWAYFDRCENVDQLYEFDKEALARLQLCEEIEPYKLSSNDRHLVYTFTFPDQQHKMKPGDAHDPRTKKSATILEIDDDNNLLRLKRGGTLDDARALTELIPGGPYRTDAQQSALVRIAQAFMENRLAEESPATFDLLANRSPRIRRNGSNGRRKLQPEQVSAESVSAVVRSLDGSHLFIQGPPGSGKTTIGSRVICDLLADGKRVAVMSTAHKAAQHLLHKVEQCMAARDKRFKGYYKHSNGDDAYQSPLSEPCITSVSSNDALEGGGYDLAGGTSWLFAREQLVGAFDYLFIDEAGQVSLADALAVSPCARNVVLLGDPSQLAQVSQGTHPLHADDSVLQHLLGDAQTVAEDRGIFLDVSSRMQPEICSFISDAMYEGRLHPAEDTRANSLSYGGEEHAGLRWLPVVHEGNATSSPEEADRIVAEVARMREAVDDGAIIVVTPYNAQRREIERRLKNAGFKIKVGTVDKFQGQEAAVVFYSMAASSGDDIPRGMRFLFERNRFNVAISRAQTLSVLVCSPRLLDVACRTPEEMALANLLCEFVERATVARPPLSSRA